MWALGNLVCKLRSQIFLLKNFRNSSSCTLYICWKSIIKLLALWFSLLMTQQTFAIVKKKILYKECTKYFSIWPMHLYTAFMLRAISLTSIMAEAVVVTCICDVGKEPLYALLYRPLISHALTRWKQLLARSFSDDAKVRVKYYITRNCILCVYNTHAICAVLTMAFPVMRSYAHHRIERRVCQAHTSALIFASPFQ